MVLIKPFSQIPLSPSPPAFTDTLIGVGGGTTDFQYTLAQIGQFNRLTGPLTLYVRTVPVTVQLSNGSPCVATWASHGLQIGDPVVFSSSYDRNTCTISIASPGVVTYANHGYAANDPVSFDTTGALPTGLALYTVYYVIAPTANTFQVAATPSGAPINTSGSQSGQQYAWRNNTIPSGVIEGAIYFVVSIFDPNHFTFSKTAGGPPINTTSNQAGKILGQTGNDNNNGLSQTRSGAFMTVGAAWTRICGFYNLNAQVVTVLCAHGTYYGGGFSLSASPANTSADTDQSPVFCSDTLTAAVAAFWLGAGEVLFLGDATNPDAVVWRSPSGAIDTNCDFDGNQTFKGFRLEYNGSPGFGDDYFQTLGFNTVILDTMIFGHIFEGGPPTTGAGVRIDVKEGTVQLVNACQILATGYTGGELFQAEGTGSFIKNDTNTITGVNNPTVVIIFQATDSGFLKSDLTVWAGKWTYSNIAFAGVQSIVINNIGILGSTNPQPDPGTGAVVGDRGIYLEFNNGPINAAQFGAPGCLIDRFYLRFVPTTGFSQTLTNSNGHVIIDAAGTLATGTVKMTPNPIDGQTVNIRTSHAITAMTFAPNTGQTVVGAPTTLAAGQKVEAIYVSGTSTWYVSN